MNSPALGCTRTARERRTRLANGRTVDEHNITACKAIALALRDACLQYTYMQACHPSSLTIRCRTNEGLVDENG
jgi:hypothetical protein